MKNNQNIKIKNKYFKEKGITLVALVVTIVVLIILATISINIVFGEEGILERARQSQQHMANAEAEEQQVLAEATNTMEEYIAGERENEENKKWNKLIEVVGTEEQTCDFTQYEELYIEMEFANHCITNTLLTDNLTEKSKIFLMPGLYASSSAYIYIAANISNSSVSIRYVVHSGKSYSDVTTLRIYGR